MWRKKRTTSQAKNLFRFFLELGPVGACFSLRTFFGAFPRVESRQNRAPKTRARVYVTGICHGYMSRVYVTGICLHARHRNMLQEMPLVLCCLLYCAVLIGASQGGAHQDEAPNLRYHMMVHHNMVQL